MYSFEDYKYYYKKYGKCVDQIQKPKNKLNEKRLLTKYNNYVKKENLKQLKLESKFKQDKYDKWDNILTQLYKRDNDRCRLSKILTDKEWEIFFDNGGFLFRELDPAHIIPRSLSKKLYYELNNLVLLDRVFHSRLDFNYHPLTGKLLNKSEIDKWWIRIIGNDLWEWLQLNK